MLDATAPRAKSLLLTVFGDSLRPHGGAIWLSSLIELMAPLRMNERLVRTAILRLTRDDWLVSTQVGRRSYYNFSPNGRERLDDAHRRIYAARTPPWDGNWGLVLTALGHADAPVRDRLRRELLWLGYGAIAPNVFAHPSPDHDGIVHLAKAVGAADDIVVMQAKSLARAAGTAPDQMLRTAWQLDKLAQDYGNFIALFSPLLTAVRATTDRTPQPSFILRTLVVHEYRRVLLRDPGLPDELMGAAWAGHAARRLARDLYVLLEASAEKFLAETVATPSGALPPAEEIYFSRFGGIARRAGR
ncbi:MAG: phenylacetic acid degradation operon negative regulatory protein PaaX [Alphaproteobacteria bacterium]